MSELELKFRLDDRAARRWQARLRASDARSLQLRARYFDTPDGRLAHSRLALRLRSEDGLWVQTLKAPGQSPIERAEDEVPLDAPDGSVPAIDPARHDGRDGAEALRDALAGADPVTWVERHSNTVERLVATLARSGGTVEAALDHGKVHAGSRKARIAELELEHRSGSPQAMFDLAIEAVSEGGLWLSILSKAERGERLLSAKPPAAAKAEPLDLPAHADGASMLRAVLRSTLAHVLPNASEVAEGADSAEIVHQLRVGLRRLRTALRELQPLSGAIDPQWELHLGRTFALLGERRDDDAVAQAVQPLLEAAGAPKTAWAPRAFADTSAAVRDAGFQDTLLRVMALAHAPDERFAECPHGALKRLVASHLDRLDRAVRRDGSRFHRLPAERQHRVRKRLKRLRYLAEFAAPLWSAKAVDHYVDRLKPAQEALGEHNDGVVAAERFRADAATDPRSWFAAGWLQANGAVTARAARRALRAIGKDARYWR